MYSTRASGRAALPMVTLVVAGGSSTYAILQVFASGASVLDISRPVQMVEKRAKQVNKKDQSQKRKLGGHCE